MISEEAIQKVKVFAFSQGDPKPEHLEVSFLAGQKISDFLGADKNVVALGTLLMDCMIGEALRQNRLQDHVFMSHKRAKEVLDELPEISLNEKEKVLNSVLQHHGAEKFASLESEIVSNADCYRFLSLSGFISGMRIFNSMGYKEMISFFSGKVLEKESILSLDFCKDDLKEQIRIIKDIFSYIKN